MADILSHLPDDEVELYLLGGAVTVRVGAYKRKYENDIDRWLLAALALAGPSGVGFTAIRRGVRLDNQAARKRISRLKEGTQLGERIESIRKFGYRLDTSGIWVDVLEFLRLVEMRASDPDARREALRKARSMLVGGLPFFVDYPPPHADTYARFESAENQVGARGQRILVVDDQIGHRLAERLRLHDHACEVATSFKEYKQFENGLSDFDLVIVDRHLESGGYNDGLGDEIVESINMRTDGVPVMMITFDVPDHMQLTDLQEAYGLAGAQRKRVDGENADLGLLVDRIEEVLLAGPVNRACEAIEKGMISKSRRAEKWLRRKYTDPLLSQELSRMTREAAEVSIIARTNDMQKARVAQRSFVVEWLAGTY